MLLSANNKSCFRPLSVDSEEVVEFVEMVEALNELFEVSGDMMRRLVGR